jgi:Na+-translocating ferredoxin:NAD+ oxidoreductase RnfD subunit
MLSLVLDLLTAVIPGWREWLILAVVAAIAIGVLRSLVGGPSSSGGD